MSFITVLDNLKNQLTADTALQAFAQSKWSKAVTVETVFRNRKEVHTKDLPLIMLTRPQVKRSDLSSVRDGQHTVRLYCGFHQNKRDLAALEMVEFEELIDAAIMKDETLGGSVLNTVPGDSLNDEGIFQPVYFLVMELDVHYRQL